jgi:lipopolysaccharide export system permease protein
MKLLKQYLFKTFSNTFFPIFTTLYIITSIIFLVKIASLTSIIQISFLELLELYSYSIPHILFYTLPISYFISLTLSIAKLSDENEMIVITTCGFKPSNVIKIFLPLTTILTVLLLITSIGLRPKADYQREQFLNLKKQEAQFNIKPSEYGQQISSWLVYVEKENNNVFDKITLLNLNKDENTLISANTATIDNLNGALNLNLKDGKSFIISNKLTQIDFQDMILHQNASSIKQIKSFNDIILYWSNIKDNEEKMRDFLFKIFISFFPILSLFFIIIFGYFNPRYNSNRASFYATILTIVYIVFINSIKNINLLFLFPLLWILLSYIVYNFTTKRIY